MKKINFQNNITKVNKATFDEFQNNIEESCVAVSPTQPETGEKVWIDNENNIIKTKNDDGTFKTIYDESEMNKTNYSTEEQVIGTYNGKPLYRKVIDTTMAISSVSTWVNIGTVDNAETVLKTTKTFDGIDESVGAGYIRSTAVQVLNSYVNIAVFNEALPSTHIVVTVEYTKTTD